MATGSLCEALPLYELLPNCEEFQLYEVDLFQLCELLGRGLENDLSYMYIQLSANKTLSFFEVSGSLSGVANGNLGVKTPHWLIGIF